jgi:hypothetical protein
MKKKGFNSVLTIQIIIGLFVLGMVGLWFYVKNQNDSSIVLDQVGLSINVNQGIKTLGPVTINSGDELSTITDNDVDIFEYYNGATWSTDSSTAYIIKYIEIDLMTEKKDEIEKDYYESLIELDLENINNLDNLPAAPDLTGDLFTELQVYGYDINKKVLSYLGNNEYDPDGYPVDFFIKEVADNGLMLFSDISRTYQFDTDKKVISIIEELGYFELDNWDSDIYKPQLSVSMADDTENPVLSPHRIVSPDGHGYIEMPDIPPFPHDLDINLGYFYDETVQFLIKSSDAVTGEINSEPIEVEVQNHNIQGYLDKALMRSPSEIEFRSRLK